MSPDYLSKLFQLKGKVVLVTGATGQLGKAICEAYCGVGANVIGVDKALNHQNMLDMDSIIYRVLDITDKDAVAETMAFCVQEFGCLDILINNAGVSCFEPFEERPEESFDWVMDVNLKGTFFCIQAYANLLKQGKKHGNIVNIASHYGVISPDFRIYTDCDRKNSEVYGATKAGIIQMTKYFAVHLASEKVRINAIAPGGIFNPKNPQGEDFIKNYSQRCPLSRMAEAEEMIGAVLYLSSNAATYTTGHTLVIDGAMSCW
jgi:NAD(P)-dependent dehydrogenase (short-subunit alcohol dehydrogenase family)